MSKYDGEIKIDTKIQTAKAEQKLLNLQNKMLKTAQKVDSITEKMEEIKRVKVENTAGWEKLHSDIEAVKVKIQTLTEKAREMRYIQTPTQEFVDLSYHLQNAEKKFDELYAKQEKMQALGQTSGMAWDSLQNSMENLGNVIRTNEASLQNMVDEGKAFTLKAVTNDSKELREAIKKANVELTDLMVKEKEMETAFNFDRDVETTAEYQVLASDLEMYKHQLELTSLEEQKARDELENIGETGEQAFGRVKKSANKTSSFIKTLANRFKGIMLSLLVFNWISKGWNAMISGMQEGFQNLAKHSEEYNRSVSSLKSANAELKNNLASAFAPIVQLAIPYLVKLIGWLNTAANAIAKFFAALQGKNSYSKAVQQNVDYASSIKDVADSAKKAAKSLAAYDELNVMQKNDESGSGTGNGGEITGANAFEEEAISEKFLAMVEKVKEILTAILPLVISIGAALLAWKIASFLGSLMEVSPLLGKIVGWLLIIIGVALAIYNYFKMWKDGVDWSGIIGYVGGVAMAVGALYALFGPVVAGIALIVASAAGIILALKDISENGLTTENVTLLLVSAIGLLVGIFLVFGSTAAIIVGIVMLVIAILAALVVAGGNGEEALGHLKDAFGALGEFVKCIFAGDMEGAFESLKKAGKSFGNFFISVAEGIANGFIKMVNAVIDAINRISFDVPDWLQEITGMQTFGFNLPHWNAQVSIPRLANGGITTGSTIAEIGEAGREAVIPLERNTEWMDTFAETLAGKINGTGTQSINLTVELDGNTVYKRVVQLDRQFAGRTGRSGFVY